MKRLKNILLVMLVMSACNPLAVNPHDTYYIQSNEHYAEGTRLKVSPVLDNHIRFAFVFNDLHYYADELETKDINKLYGLTTISIHSNSARFGWRHTGGDKIEIFAYWYKGGARGFKSLGTVGVRERHVYSLDATGSNYTWTLDDTQFTVNGTKKDLYHRAFPYFGGDNPAPHYMFFTINEL